MLELTEDERRFLDEVVFSEAERERAWEEHIRLMEMDFGHLENPPI